VTAQLFPTARLCGTCKVCQWEHGNGNGYCPKLDLRVTRHTKACRTHYEAKEGTGA
jgi:hypothetical protein